MSIIKFSHIFTEELEKLETVKDIETLANLLKKIKLIEDVLSSNEDLKMQDVLAIEGFEHIIDDGILFSYDDLRLIGIINEEAKEILFLGIVTYESMMKKVLDNQSKKI